MNKISDSQSSNENIFDKNIKENESRNMFNKNSSNILNNKESSNSIFDNKDILINPLKNENKIQDKSESLFKNKEFNNPTTNIFNKNKDNLFDNKQNDYNEKEEKTNIFGNFDNQKNKTPIFNKNNESNNNKGLFGLSNEEKSSTPILNHLSKNVENKKNIFGNFDQNQEDTKKVESKSLFGNKSSIKTSIGTNNEIESENKINLFSNNNLFPNSQLNSGSTSNLFDINQNETLKNNKNENKLEKENEETPTPSFNNSNPEPENKTNISMLNLVYPKTDNLSEKIGTNSIFDKRIEPIVEENIKDKVPNEGLNNSEPQKTASLFGNAVLFKNNLNTNKENLSLNGVNKPIDQDIKKEETQEIKKIEVSQNIFDKNSLNEKSNVLENKEITPIIGKSFSLFNKSDKNSSQGKIT